MEVTDALLPSAKGRSGRHYERQHLSGILLKYRHRLAEFVSTDSDGAVEGERA